jgi:ABC-type Fe3+/spermidine/putrescine transport system ATPase subunit
LSGANGAADIQAHLNRVAEGSAVAAIRPEDVLIVRDGDVAADGQRPVRELRIEATIETVTFTGREAEYFVRTSNDIGLAVHVTRPTEALVAAAGATVTLALPFENLLFFDGNTENRIQGV